MTGAVAGSATAVRGDTEAGSRRASGGRRHRLSVGPWLRLVSPLVLLIAWQVLSTNGVIPASKLSPPTQVWAAARELWGTGELQAALGVSLQRVGIGLTLGVVLAVALGLLVGFFRIADLAIDPPLHHHYRCSAPCRSSG